MISMVGFVTIHSGIVKEKLPCCIHLLKCVNYNNENNEGEQFQQVETFDHQLDADRIVRSEQYLQWGYDSIS